MLVKVKQCHELELFTAGRRVVREVIQLMILKGKFILSALKRGNLWAFGK